QSCIDSTYLLPLVPRSTSISPASDRLISYRSYLAVRRSVLLGLATVLGPLDVEGALGVHALVGVGAEVVALGLDQGGREALGAHRVVVGQGRGEDRDRVAGGRREGDDAAPGRDALGDLLGEVRIGQEQRQVRVALVG